MAMLACFSRSPGSLVGVPLVVGKSEYGASSSAPRVSFAGAFFTQTRQHHWRIGGGVNRLHGRDDTQLAEARNIGGIEVLRVLNAPAQVLRIGVGFEGFLVQIENHAVAAVANSVDAHL